MNHYCSILTFLAWFWLCSLHSGCSTKPPEKATVAIPVQSPSGVPMIFLSGGTFRMGTSQGEQDEQPAHTVRVSPFYMDQFEVTHELFTKAQLPNPSKWQDDPRKPVEQVRWRDAKQYCNERSLLEGLEPCYDEASPGWPCRFTASGYRLPTEAEWEFACRAGNQADYDFGNVGDLKQFAIFAENGQSKTHPVGSKKPNAWGFHDLYGNVSEWCQDIYDPTYYAQSPAEDPSGPDEANASGDVKRVLRGGSWKSTATMCRVTFRQGQRTGDTDACFYTDFCGFRCVRRPSTEELQSLISSAVK